MFNTLAQPSSLDNLPAELTAGPHFCLWQRPENVGKRRSKRAGKKPIQSLTGRTAHQDIPQEFTTFYATRRAFENNTYPKQAVEGIGRRIVHQADGMWALDVDTCAVDGELNGYARMLVDALGSYGEFTPSNHGIRLYGFGELPYAIQSVGSTKIWIKGSHPDYPNIEAQLFIQGQWVTVTGNQIPGTPNFVATNQEFTDALLSSNPKKAKHYFGYRGPAARQEATTPKPRKCVAAPVIADGRPNYKQVNSRIKHMIKTNEYFRKDWFKKSSMHQTNSEYQYALVKHYYVRYQPCKADIRVMLQSWCKMWEVEYQESRLNSWMRDAHIAYEKSGRVPYPEHEAKRKREERAEKKEAKLAKQAEASDKTTRPTHMSGLGRNVVRPSVEYGDRTPQVVALRAEGKSFGVIGKTLGIHKNTAATLFYRHIEKLAVPEAQPDFVVEQEPAVMPTEPVVIEPVVVESAAITEAAFAAASSWLEDFSFKPSLIMNQRYKRTKQKPPPAEENSREWGFSSRADFDLYEPEQELSVAA